MYLTLMIIITILILKIIIIIIIIIIINIIQLTPHWSSLIVRNIYINDIGLYKIILLLIATYSYEKLYLKFKEKFRLTAFEKRILMNVWPQMG